MPRKRNVDGDSPLRNMDILLKNSGWSEFNWVQPMLQKKKKRYVFLFHGYILIKLFPMLAFKKNNKIFWFVSEPICYYKYFPNMPLNFLDSKDIYVTVIIFNLIKNSKYTMECLSMPSALFYYQRYSINCTPQSSLSQGLSDWRGSQEGFTLHMSLSY